MTTLRAVVQLPPLLFSACFLVSVHAWSSDDISTYKVTDKSDGSSRTFVVRTRSRDDHHLIVTSLSSGAEGQEAQATGGANAETAKRRVITVHPHPWSVSGAAGTHHHYRTDFPSADGLIAANRLSSPEDIHHIFHQWLSSPYFGSESHEELGTLSEAGRHSARLSKYTLYSYLTRYPLFCRGVIPSLNVLNNLVSAPSAPETPALVLLLPIPPIDTTFLSLIEPGTVEIFPHIWEPEVESNGESEFIVHGYTIWEHAPRNETGSPRFSDLINEHRTKLLVRAYFTSQPENDRVQLDRLEIGEYLVITRTASSRRDNSQDELMERLWPRWEEYLQQEKRLTFKGKTYSELLKTYQKTVDELGYNSPEREELSQHDTADELLNPLDQDIDEYMIYRYPFDNPDSYHRSQNFHRDLELCHWRAGQSRGCESWHPDNCERCQPNNDDISTYTVTQMHDDSSGTLVVRTRRIDDHHLLITRLSSEAEEQEAGAQATGGTDPVTAQRRAITVHPYPRPVSAAAALHNYYRTEFPFADRSMPANRFLSPNDAHNTFHQWLTGQYSGSESEGVLVTQNVAGRHNGRELFSELTRYPNFRPGVMPSLNVLNTLASSTTSATSELELILPIPPIAITVPSRTGSRTMEVAPSITNPVVETHDGSSFTVRGYTRWENTPSSETGSGFLNGCSAFLHALMCRFSGTDTRLPVADTPLPVTATFSYQPENGRVQLDHLEIEGHLAITHTAHLGTDDESTARLWLWGEYLRQEARRAEECEQCHPDLPPETETERDSEQPSREVSLDDLPASNENGTVSSDNSTAPAFDASALTVEPLPGSTLLLPDFNSGPK